MNALTTFAQEKRKVIEIKRDVLRTRRARPFNRKIDALVHFQWRRRAILRMSPCLSAPDRDAAEALCAAVSLHGAAADVLVRAGCGPVGLTASELIAPSRRLLNDLIAEAAERRPTSP